MTPPLRISASSTSGVRTCNGAAGAVLAESRRTGPEPVDEGSATRGIPCVRSQARHAAVRPRNPAPARPDAQGRPATDRAGVLADVLDARHARRALWRGDRHG